MNAHTPESQLRSAIPSTVTATPAWFTDLCDHRAGLYVEGILDLHEAVDELHAYAKLTGLNRRIGRDTVQHIMAVAFAAPSLVPDEQVQFEVGDIVKCWELADPRDRWKWTGEAPPPPEAEFPIAPRQPYSTSWATEKAFWHVVRNESGEYLKRWLARHPSDAAFLLNLWKQKNARQTVDA